jgi:hypothetical protein
LTPRASGQEVLPLCCVVNEFAVSLRSGGTWRPETAFLKLLDSDTARMIEGDTLIFALMCLEASGLNWADACQTLVQSSTHPTGLAAVDFYFIQDDGGMFKATVPYEPYFYVTCRVRSLCAIS